MFSRTSQIWPLPFAGSSLGVLSLSGPGSNSWHFSWFCSWSYSCPVFGSTHAPGKTLDPTSVLGSSIGLILVFLLVQLLILILVLYLVLLLVLLQVLLQFLLQVLIQVLFQVLLQLRSYFNSGPPLGLTPGPYPRPSLLLVGLLTREQCRLKISLYSI